MAAPRRIALIVPRDSEYARDVLRGVAAFARPDLPWRFELFDGGGAYRAALRWGAEGAIVFLTPGTGRAAEHAGLPMVNIGAMAHSSRIPAVGNDDEAIGRVGAQALIDAGLRHSAFIGMRDHLGGRERGFRTAMASAGIPTVSWTAGTERQVARWLRSLPRPCGLMASATGLGWRLAEIARSAGIAVPEELALIACDDESDLCALAYPAISVVRCNSVAIGREAARLMVRLLAGERIPRVTMLPPIGVVHRQSTDVATAGDAVVAAAVAALRERFAVGVSIERLAGELAVSRRALEQRFQRWLGRGPAAELRRIRVDRACELLATTKDKVAAIARRCGFAGTRQLERALKQQRGLPPAAWREGFAR
jgi:LacI family transcriptional regulator